MPRDATQELYDLVMSCRHDPVRFVAIAFPWGQPGPLATEAGPEPWQRELLDRLGKGLATTDEAVREATASGHGIGKSCLVAWIILWAMSTCPDTRGIVTANTENQLRIKTWPELAKWWALLICKDWFKMNATALFSSLPDKDRTWRVDAITWSENNLEAIAGLHNRGKRAFALMDEASAIPEGVWETIEGALTDSDTELLFCVFGNPTQPSGRFRQCFAGGQFAHRWHWQQIDARTVSFTKKKQIAQWVQDYGEDHDFVRVRVRGEFPRAGSMQFISSEVVDEAIKRALAGRDDGAALVMGVDIARHGDDQTVISFRRGLDARSIPAVKVRIPDLMALAAHVSSLSNSHQPSAVFVDATGMGWGVYDRLRQMGMGNVFAVDFGGKADRPDGHDATAKYANKRAEMWGHMREWLKQGCLPNDRELQAELTAVEYGYNAQDCILLEKKDAMRVRGLASPDNADSLALTFAQPVVRRDVQAAEDRLIEEAIAKLKKRIV